MITIGIKNTPAGALRWRPVIYKDGVPYYPNDSLPLTQTWQTNVTGVVDFRAVVYASTQLQKDLYGVTLVVGKTYIFDWSTGQLSESGLPPGFPPLNTGMILVIAIVIGLVIWSNKRR